MNEDLLFFCWGLGRSQLLVRSLSRSRCDLTLLWFSGSAWLGFSSSLNLKHMPLIIITKKMSFTYAQCPCLSCPSTESWLHMDIKISVSTCHCHPLIKKKVAKSFKSLPQPEPPQTISFNIWLSILSPWLAPFSLWIKIPSLRLRILVRIWVSWIPIILYWSLETRPIYLDAHY